MFLLVVLLKVVDYFSNTYDKTYSVMLLTKWRQYDFATKTFSIVKLVICKRTKMLISKATIHNATLLGDENASIQWHLVA